MKQIKFIVTILIACSIGLQTFASVPDASGHWALEAIEKLMTIGAVSGDENGKIRPDDALLRSELVRVVNKAFGLTEKGDVGFLDVESGQWYYDEFLIAAKAGYITGDDHGRANPKAFVTRGEMSVIFSRLLKLSNTAEKLSFSDEGAIPKWAYGAVGALVKSGLLSGYPDGTIRVDTSVTRGELFYLAAKALDKKMPEKSEPSTPTVGNVNSVSMGGGSGGSGGSQGSRPTPAPSSKVLVPLIQNFDTKENVLYFNQSANARRYEALITSGENQETVLVDHLPRKEQNSVSLQEAFLQISEKYEDSNVKYQIKIRAIGNPGYIDSDYSDSFDVDKEYPALAKPNTQMRAGYENGVFRGIVFWDLIEGADTYLYELTAAGSPVARSLYHYNEADQEIVIPRLGELSYPVEFRLKAITPDKGQIKNSPESTLILPKEESEIKIYTAQQFEQIRLAPHKNYILMNSLELGQFTPIDQFTGTLRTFENRPLYLNVDINESTMNNVGIFRNLSQKGAISGIIVTGSVNGAQQVGGLAGNLNDTAEISNCINLATVKGTSNVGGLAGINKSMIRNSFNGGGVSGSSTVGGIVGYNQKTVTSCGNIASVTAGTYVGGIAGSAWAVTISNSYNTGDIKATYGDAGGILGGTNSTNNSITGCYNTGSITATNQSAGITGFVGANAAISIDSCYQTGVLTAKSAYPFVNLASGKISLTTALYTLPAEEDNHTGTTLIEEAELANRSTENESLKNLLKAYFEFSEVAGTYPMIKNNHQISLGDVRIYPVVKELSASIHEEGNIVFSWEEPDSAEVEGVEITLKDNTRILTLEENVALAPNETTFTLEEGKQGHYYEIEVQLIYSDGTKSATVLEWMVP